MSGVSFSSREDPSGIFLLMNVSNGGALQYWELREQERPIHSLFSTATAMTHFLQWQCVSIFNCNNHITYICPSRNVWLGGNDMTPQHHLIIATASGDLICLHRENMKQV